MSQANILLAKVLNIKFLAFAFFMFMLWFVWRKGNFGWWSNIPFFGFWTTTSYLLLSLIVIGGFFFAFSGGNLSVRRVIKK